jgi:hypothetical protein
MKPRTAITLLAVVIGLIVAWRYERYYSRQWSAQIAQQNLQKALENAVYYRFKAFYVVKDTQEHIDFDYVAACTTLVTTYKDGGQSVDPFGPFPKTFIKATNAGHAIQVATPKACRGEARTGDIPPDLFPFAVFYEDVANMRFGWGYASEDAYDNAKARMTFEGATITPATYAEWVVWRDQAQANFKPLGEIASPWGYSVEDQRQNDIARICRGYARTPLLDNAKEAVRQEWRKLGRPQFWLDTGGLRADAALWRPTVEGAFVSAAIPRTRGAGPGLIGNYSRTLDLIHRKEPHVVAAPNEIYPVLPSAMVATPAADLEHAVFPRKLLIADEWKGFVACGSPKSGFDDLLDEHFKSIDKAMLQHKVYDKKPFTFMANDVVLITETGTAELRTWLFEGDQFLLQETPSSVDDFY